MKQSRALRLTRETLGDLTPAQLAGVGAGNELATTTTIYGTPSLQWTLCKILDAATAAIQIKQTSLTGC